MTARIAWTDERDAYIRAHPDATAAEIGAALGVSANAVRLRRSRLGLACALSPADCTRRRDRAPAAPATRADALADALRRDARPDDDKVDARITLLKLLWRRTQRRRKEATI